MIIDNMTEKEAKKLLKQIMKVLDDYYVERLSPTDARRVSAEPYKVKPHPVPRTEKEKRYYAQRRTG